MSDGQATSRGGTFPTRRGTPPPMGFFEAPRPAAGEASFGLSLDAIRIRLEGLDAPRATDLARRYGPYAGAVAPGPGVLRVRVALEDRDYFIDPPSSPEFNPVWIEPEGTHRIRYAGYKVAGWFDTLAGEGTLLLARGDYEPDLRSFENFIRVAVAWRAAELGGAFVHGASAVWRDRAYLFFGESGAGKSTLAAADRRGRIVSDDLTLLLPRPGAAGLDVVGSPFRGTYEGGEPVVGRFPLAAGFRLVKADLARVVAAPRVLVLGQLVGNLTFVAEAFDRRPDLFASVERAFATTPLAHLHFTRDDSYWDAIAAAGWA
ncbi:MAG TPA: hypothetical protein VF139_12385 [Candidatus Polarisedimenticolaceae bacterium]